jgi:hypothetical protein
MAAAAETEFQATPELVLDALRKNPSIAAMVARTTAIARAAVGAKRPDVLSGSAVADLTGVELPSLDAASADTPFGNVLLLLDAGAQNHGQWLLLGALVGLGYAELWEAQPADPSLLNELVWISSATPCDPWPSLDDALSVEHRQSLWGSVAAAISNPLTPQAERAILLLALVRAESEVAQGVAGDCLLRSQDPATTALLASRVRAAAPLTGELVRERGALRTTLMAITGLLFVTGSLRLLARYTLGLRRRAALTLTPRGIELLCSTHFLGRTIRETQRFFPLDQVASLSRATRHDGFGLYAGLGALALGSYVGVGLVVDGLRAPGGSPSLLGLGLGVVLVGVTLDFLLMRLFGWKQGLVRLVVQPVRGRGLALLGVDSAHSHAVLTRVTQLRGYSRF